MSDAMTDIVRYLRSARTRRTMAWALGAEGSISDAYMSMATAVLSKMADAEIAAPWNREAAADLREAAKAAPWSFHRGTLRERLEWCRVQHQLAAGRLSLPPERTVEEYARWHQDCADWYVEMLDQLDALLPLTVGATPDPLAGSTGEHA